MNGHDVVNNIQNFENLIKNCTANFVALDYSKDILSYILENADHY